MKHSKAVQDRERAKECTKGIDDMCVGLKDGG